MALLESLPAQGSIVTYSGYERRVVNGLAQAVPRHADRLLALCDRMVDLLAIVRSNVRHPGFRGSYSLKSVLPVLVPGMGYADMEIADGMTAATSYARMIGEDTSAWPTNCYQRCPANLLRAGHRGHGPGVRGAVAGIDPSKKLNVKPGPKMVRYGSEKGMDNDGILGIENRTENWKTAYYFAPFFRDDSARLRLTTSLGAPKSNTSNDIQIELFWKGMRDYFHQEKQPTRNNPSFFGVLAERYVCLFPELREEIKRFDSSGNELRLPEKMEL